MCIHKEQAKSKIDRLIMLLERLCHLIEESNQSSKDAPAA